MKSIEHELAVKIRFVEGPEDPAWQLRWRDNRYPNGLIGWITASNGIDSGVPNQVAQVLCNAFCRSRLITFLHDIDSDSQEWQRQGFEWTKVLRPTGLQRLHRRSYPLIATMSAEHAMELFNAEPFSWTLQAQAAFLSSEGNGPPDFTWNQIDAFFRNPFLDRDNSIIPEGVNGLILPGVDGDFLQVVSFRALDFDGLKSDLAEECRIAGVDWVIVPESELKRSGEIRGDQGTAGAPG